MTLNNLELPLSTVLCYTCVYGAHIQHMQQLVTQSLVARCYKWPTADSAKDGYDEPVSNDKQCEATSFATDANDVTVPVRRTVNVIF